MLHSIVECRKPVIAPINGPAPGAGLAVAASCDQNMTVNLQNSEDSKEAMRAFVEKRKPLLKGR
ncbi:hypothetical protein [Reyranella sp.]|jgi:enoyl-CoA hydratase/carnithine racemase|uniref:hypothetical protein n=1 Tax=Reyranella sp. TaxID=1929291 RepID=UPI002F93DC0C